MKKFCLFLLLAILPMLPGAAGAQTQHGGFVTITAPTIPAGGAAIAGYILSYATCPGGTCGAFTAYNTSSTLITGSSVVLPTTLFSASTEYGFQVVTQDVNGNQSAASATVTATTPSVWPS